MSGWTPKGTKGPITSQYFKPTFLSYRTPLIEMNQNGPKNQVATFEVMDGL